DGVVVVVDSGAGAVVEVGGTVVSGVVTGTVVSVGTLVLVSPGTPSAPQATRAVARAAAAVSRTTERNVVLKTMKLSFSITAPSSEPHVSTRSPSCNRCVTVQAGRRANSGSRSRKAP